MRKADQLHKTILVTGATSGIGKATALKLAEDNHTVILVGRDPARGANVRKELVNKTKNEKLIYVNADLSVFKQVIDLSDTIKKQFSQLDVLINNAGVVDRKRIITPDGIEHQWAVNYFSPFLLTHQLLHLIKASPQGRIINVASDVHRGASSHNLDFTCRSKTYIPTGVYAETKLAIILFTYLLSDKLKSTSVTVNCLHPGVIATGLLAEFMGLPRALSFAGKIMGASPDKGASASVFLATSTEVNEVTGKYFIDKKKINSSPASYNMDLAKKLWDKTVEIIEHHFKPNLVK